ncbi:MAG: hypothetical protein ACHP65_06330 [Legionellales bacterium]
MRASAEFFKQQLQAPRKPILVLSLDYDGCTDILFPELSKQETPPEVHQKVSNLTEKFHAFVDAKALEADANVMVYVGSNRQSQQINKLNAKKGNGCCFTNLQTLCKDKGWYFNPLLMADIQNKQVPGSAILDASLTCNIEENKICLIETQLADIAMKYPEAQVNYYFFDDDPPGKNIFLSLREHYLEYGNINKVPNNICLHLVQLDWYAAIVEQRDTLIITDTIQGQMATKPVEQASANAAEEDHKHKKAKTEVDTERNMAAGVTP